MADLFSFFPFVQNAAEEIIDFVLILIKELTLIREHYAIPIPRKR
jgi:hypothetical protein